MSFIKSTNHAHGGRAAVRFFHHLFALALVAAAPLVGGCTVIVTDNGGHGATAGDDDLWDACYDDYDACLDDADGDKDAVLTCGDQLDRCIGDGGDGQGSGGGASAGDSSGSGGSGAVDDSGGGDPAAEVCVALHQACIAEADTIEATLACEALFDHCAHPGVCESDPCPKSCDGLDLCLADYGGCVAAAEKDYEVEACNLIFDGCVADEGGDLCLPDDDAKVDACLAEHELCTACAANDAELAACVDVFEACVNPPT